ncbi:GspE/PulE family protein [Idiomarina seosinensis]|nr:GspE/PulE family protein [Idiomarina seosinensis]
MHYLGQCRNLPRSRLPLESQLAAGLTIPEQSICILHHSDEMTLLAISDSLRLTQSTVSFFWQQLSNSPLYLLALESLPSTPLADSIEDINQWLQQLLEYSLQQQASDIHLEPQQSEWRIRLRIAGQLITAVKLNSEHGKQLSARIKVLADLDITEHFQPQDGRFSARPTDGQSRDFRVSCCPVINGEKIVIRCLGTLTKLPSLSQLSFSSQQLLCIEQALKQSQGLILVTGPTGSGKTSTLYSMLQRLNPRELNICTVEDPVEIRFDGINQVPVNPRRQLTFASILKTLLRQDPDVLLVGEIRDGETARVALQAAQTGHLVLATLHTNSAIDSIVRLRALGLPEDEIFSALSLLMSQRLLRKLCSNCSGKGCHSCDNGYLGQLAIFEVIPCLNQGHNRTLTASNLAKYLQARELPTLYQHALEHVTAGRTSRAQAGRLIDE